MAEKNFFLKFPRILIGNRDAGQSSKSCGDPIDSFTVFDPPVDELSCLMNPPYGFL
jgi:hypothetical protein